jgi:hypothetical protein
MTNPKFTEIGSYCSVAVEYEPKANLTALDRFHIAECARKRMTEYVCDIVRWRGERRSFYTALQMMEVDEVKFMD